MDGKRTNICPPLGFYFKMDLPDCGGKNVYHVFFPPSSSLVNYILCEAFEKLQRKFRVIVVDSRPRLEGREALRRLVKRGIRCTYVLISALSYILPEACNITPVFYCT